MKVLVPILFCLFGLSALSQNPDGFDAMAKRMSGRNTPILTAKEVQQKQKDKQTLIFLDTREEKEYKVSHLPGAIWVGYDNVDWKAIEKMNKDATIVVYCSVGYRSGKITDDMRKKGFTKVYNLYGGLFNWANNGGTIEGPKNQPTNQVHGYNEKWSHYLNADRVKVIL